MYTLTAQYDGFYSLELDGEEVYMIHDDKINQLTDDSNDPEERLNTVINYVQLVQGDC